VILLDVEMPGPGLEETVRRVRGASPFSQIVVLTMHENVEIVRRALGLGVTAFLSKTISREELITSVRSAADESGRVLLAVSRETSAQLHGPAPARSALSPREKDVLRLLAQARSNSQIGAELFITEGTVKRHLTSIYSKLNAVSRLDALRRATAAGLIEGLAPGAGD
jgi:DNA-binding NarL/FixJ family response regulator